ncbi:four helix bundle protein [bacterium]|nr:four helix bundle protein [bacterium]
METKRKIQRFEDLIVWLKAMCLAEELYRVTNQGEFAKDWGLKNQIQRAVVSIPSNIAEGYGRFSNKDFKHFLAIANGSANELRTQVQLAANIGYIDREIAAQLVEKCVEVSKMLKGLRAKISAWFLVLVPSLGTRHQVLGTASQPQFPA